MGLCQGMPNKIPVVEKDFIFAAISEEMGGIFAICVLLICLGCFIQFMMIATKMQAMFYKMLAVGLGMEYVVQVFLTVGGVTKFIPLTGVTLPFLSYGGSSLVTSMGALGILIGLCQKQGEVVAIQERKIRRIRLAAILVAVLLLSNLFYWQIIKGPEVIERMLELI